MAGPVCRCWAFSVDKRDEYMPKSNEFTSLDYSDRNGQWSFYQHLYFVMLCNGALEFTCDF